MKSDEELYELAANELKESPRQGLLIKCMAKADGDEQKGKALYIKTRVAELSIDSKKHKIQDKMLKFKAWTKKFFRKCFPSKNKILLSFVLVLIPWLILVSYTEPYNSDPVYLLGYFFGIFTGLFISSVLIGNIVNLIFKSDSNLDRIFTGVLIVLLIFCGIGASYKDFRLFKLASLTNDNWCTKGWYWESREGEFILNFRDENIDINNDGVSDSKRVYGRYIDKSGRWEGEGFWNWDVDYDIKVYFPTSKRLRFSANLSLNDQTLTSDLDGSSKGKVMFSKPAWKTDSSYKRYFF